MASPVLHVKDTYFFEVPKALWPRHYDSMDEVPEFIREAHPHTSLEEFNYELSGKILIPQPFAKLKNLYEVESGFAISKFMVVELGVALLLFFAFSWLANRTGSQSRPIGRLHNLLETLVEFIRDQVARPAIGGKEADRFVPYLLTVFFFILACNLVGMIPIFGTITGMMELTAVLALCTFGIGIYSGIQKFGPGGYVLNFVPHMDLPGPLAPLKILIFLIEVLGTFIKHAVLAIRLFANMVAGHMVLAGIIGAVISAASTGAVTWAMGGLFGVLGATAFSLLELLVAFIQAYVFTMLSALFIGMSIHHH